MHLETGRTHQIRVHMAAVRHPCVGDVMYGADPVLAKRLGLSRQWLHAAQPDLRAPGDRRRDPFESPLPADLRHALESCARRLIAGGVPCRLRDDVGSAGV